MKKVSIVFSTIDSNDQALKISEVLVSQRLAACVNILPAVTSVYRWQNRIHKDSELLLIIKTKTDKLEALIDQLRQIHPYDVPEIIAFPVEKGLTPYLDWVLEQT
jgi:periplasmic divalent cation tolerance protein